MNEIFVVPIVPFSSVEEHEFGPQTPDEKRIGEISFQGKSQISDLSQFLTILPKKLNVKVPQEGIPSKKTTSQLTKSALRAMKLSTFPPTPAPPPTATSQSTETSSSSHSTKSALRAMKHSTFPQTPAPPPTATSQSTETFSSSHSTKSASSTHKDGYSTTGGAHSTKTTRQAHWSPDYSRPVCQELKNGQQINIKYHKQVQ
eukprot:GHVP01007669.1.p1 GENE.GHVP01007669.1~~GHVP01007669.1.p1  ORF type:complete len:209 (-),score=41.79 GHVP01007669.1:246-851(-)